MEEVALNYKQMGVDGPRASARGPVGSQVMVMAGSTNSPENTQSLPLSAGR
jgi:hypothetical protein